MLKTEDRGAAAVEMALVLPILLLLVCGIVDFGRAYNAKVTLTHAAREGVRVWSLTADPVAAEQRARRAAAGLNPDWLTVEPCAGGDGECITAACTYGEPTRLLATYQMPYVTPLGALIRLYSAEDDGLPASVTLAADGVMRCEK